MEELARRLRGLLRGRRVCGVAVDVDGTLTERRGSGHFRVSLEAVEALRRLEDRGVPVMLVTGNSVYVAAGVARYLGASGPHVAENGCVVFYAGRVYSVCRFTARQAGRLVEEELGGVLEPSWQNPCRMHDYAFIARGVGGGEALRMVERLLESRGLLGRVRLGHSGYAVHIRPVDASKGAGLLFAARLRGIDPSCVVAVGDSAMDAEMAESGAVLAAVGNAEPELRRRAHLVLPGESGASVRALVDAMVEAGLA